MTALAYVAGFQYFAYYDGLLRVPWRADGAETPLILYRGSFCLFNGALGTFLSRVFIKPSVARLLRWNFIPAAQWIVPGLTTLLLTDEMWFLPISRRNIIICIVLYLTAVYLLMIATDGEIPKLQRASFGIGALYIILWAASYHGTIVAELRIATAVPDTQFLLTPDSADLGRHGLKL